MDNEHEYIALVWHTPLRQDDEAYIADLERLRAMDWEGIAWSNLEVARNGGACIMRKVIEKPRMWTKKEMLEIFDHVIAMLDKHKRETGG